MTNINSIFNFFNYLSFKLQYTHNTHKINICEILNKKIILLNVFNKNL